MVLHVMSYTHTYIDFEPVYHIMHSTPHTFNPTHASRRRPDHAQSICVKKEKPQSRLRRQEGRPLVDLEGSVDSLNKSPRREEADST